MLNTNSTTGKLTTQTKANSNQELNKLDELAKADNQALFTCTTQFPFTLFPTIISVDRNKVTIREYFFFTSRQVHTLLIKDIMTVFVTDAVLFSQIELVHSRFPDEKISIEYVNKEDARKFQLLIQGLMVAEKESIDVTGIPQPQLVNKLKQVGHTAVNTIQG